MPTIHCYFENKAAAACATSALNKFCSICTAFRCLHRIWDRPEAVVLSLLEKKTENYIAIRIPGKDADSVLNAMQSLREEFGEKFSQVFKTITVDNGSEFSAFSQVESWGCAVYFAHPYTSWERPQNERHNGLFRTFVPKGVSIEAFSAEYILAAADELNGRPRKKLGYRTPEELFDEFLDSVYAAEGCGSIAQDGSLRLPS